jgi:hypothetical protein
MFSKLSALCVTGAMLLSTGSSLQAQDYRHNNWGYQPAYVASNSSGYYGQASQNRFRDDGCDFKNHNGSGYSSAYRGGTYGSAWPGAQWGGGYSYTQPYRSSAYLPAYRVSGYSNNYGYSQPGYRSTSTYGSSHLWSR